MSTQQYDSNGNPIFSTSALGSPDQQVSDSNGLIINPAKEDGNLLSIKTDLDKFTFTSTRLLTDGSGVTQPISGTITVGNSTLAVTQSGTWNITNISGTISLPTGASTETTLLAVKTDLDEIALDTDNLAGIKTNTDKFTFTSTRLLVDGSGVTQPVSGTITANIGTTNGLALDATLTGGTMKTKLVDSGGTNVATISAAGALKVDGSAVTQPVSGTVTSQQGSGNVLNPWAQNLIQLNGSTLLTGNGVTGTGSQRVTIASDNTAFTVNAAQSGNWSVRLQDGSGTAITSSALGSRQALDVNNVDGLQALTAAGKHFATVVEVNLPTTAETAFFYFKNPNASGKNIYIDRVFIDTTMKGAIISTRLYKDPTSSANGTAATVVNLDVQASPAAAVATPFTNPTVSANGSKIGFFTVGANANTPEYMFDLGILVEPNNALLMTGVGDANNRVVVVTFYWIEI